MPRVHCVTARKDYPAIGVKKGEKYYWWKSRQHRGQAGVVRRSKTRPRPSQLTMSDYLSQAYSIQEGVEADTQGPFRDLQDCQSIGDVLRSAAEEARTLGEEQQGKFDNMPEGLQQGETGQLLERRTQACEAVADELEQAADDLADLDEEEDDEGYEDHKPGTKSALEKAASRIEDAVMGLAWDWEG